MLIEFWAPFLALTFCIVIFEARYHMLRDLSNSSRKPFSWARVQLAWWSVIILSSFIAILWVHGSAPDLNQDTLILLGISATTIATARVIDVNEETSETVTRNQDEGGQNFFLDILSDANGVSIHRFQTIVFNLAFGCWYLGYVLKHMDASATNKTVAELGRILPELGQNNLILLGLSAATYVALKTTENKSVKPASDEADTVTDENPFPQMG